MVITVRLHVGSVPQAVSEVQPGWFGGLSDSMCMVKLEVYLSQHDTQKQNIAVASNASASMGNDHGTSFCHMIPQSTGMPRFYLSIIEKCQPKQI